MCNASAATQGLDRFGKDIITLSTRNPFLAEQPPKQAPSLAAVFAGAPMPDHYSPDAAALHRYCQCTCVPQLLFTVCLALPRFASASQHVFMY